MYLKGSAGTFSEVYTSESSGAIPIFPEATVSFHSFKSQNFKLSVSHSKNKYVVYVSVLSRISNCQGLGRKNKFEVLKTDRNNYMHRYMYDYTVDKSCFLLNLETLLYLILLVFSLFF